MHFVGVAQNVRAGVPSKSHSHCYALHCATTCQECVPLHTYVTKIPAARLRKKIRYSTQKHATTKKTRWLARAVGWVCNEVCNNYVTKYVALTGIEQKEDSFFRPLPATCSNLSLNGKLFACTFSESMLCNNVLCRHPWETTQSAHRVCNNGHATRILGTAARKARAPDCHPRLSPRCRWAGECFTARLKPHRKNDLTPTKTTSRSSSRQDRIRVPDFVSVVYFSRGTLPQKRVKGAPGGPRHQPKILRIPPLFVQRAACESCLRLCLTSGRKPLPGCEIDR